VDIVRSLRPAGIRVLLNRALQDREAKPSVRLHRRRAGADIARSLPAGIRVLLNRASLDREVKLSIRLHRRRAVVGSALLLLHPAVPCHGVNRALQCPAAAAAVTGIELLPALWDSSVTTLTLTGAVRPVRSLICGNRSFEAHRTATLDPLAAITAAGVTVAIAHPTMVVPTLHPAMEEEVADIPTVQGVDTPAVGIPAPPILTVEVVGIPAGDTPAVAIPVAAEEDTPAVAGTRVEDITNSQRLVYASRGM